MLAFIFALGLGNAGMLPPAHESYDLCASVALPLSVALGLMSAAAQRGQSLVLKAPSPDTAGSRKRRSATAQPFRTSLPVF